MGKYYETLLTELKKRENIFICGPRYNQTKLRAYACGGLLCEIPTARGELSMPSANYCKYAPELETVLGKNGTAKKGEERVQLLLDNLDSILKAMDNRFSNASGECKERKIQNIIACSHTSFAGPDHTVICDWENSIPEKDYARADTQRREKKPNFDMIAFSADGGKGVFSIIELKCNKKACLSEKSGLKVHAEDMLVCEQLGDWYKKYLMCRLQNMIDYQLLEDIPDNLADILQNPERIGLRKCFLFTQGEGLASRGIAAKLCQDCIPEYMQHKFSYMFAEEPENTDFSHMECLKILPTVNK